MQRCDKLVDVGRRQFLRGGGVAAAGGRLQRSGRPARQATPALGAGQLSLHELANVNDLKVNEPFDVAYPDDDAPGVLLKLGKAVEGGAGPDGDIVGFTTLCPHKGFPLVYAAGDQTLNCPGHYSRFDCEKRRPADLGPGDPEPAAVHASASTTTATSTPRRRRAHLRPPVERL